LCPLSYREIHLRVLGQKPLVPSLSTKRIFVVTLFALSVRAGSSHCRTPNGVLALYQTAAFIGALAVRHYPSTRLNAVRLFSGFVVKNSSLSCGSWLKISSLPRVVRGRALCSRASSVQRIYGRFFRYLFTNIWRGATRVPQKTLKNAKFAPKTHKKLGGENREIHLFFQNFVDKC
jgi:hypothetical protein